MKDHWENDEKMMRENTREPVVSFLILPGVCPMPDVTRKKGRQKPCRENSLGRVSLRDNCMFCPK